MLLSNSLLFCYVIISITSSQVTNFNYRIKCASLAEKPFTAHRRLLHFYTSQQLKLAARGHVQFIIDEPEQ